MNLSVINTNQYLFWIAGGLAILLSLISADVLIAIPIIFVIGLIYYYSEKILIGIIIVSYLTSLSEYIGDARLFVNLISTILLLYIFLKQFGLKLHIYPKLPVELLFFLVALFLILSISTIFSSYVTLGIVSIITMAGFFTIVYMFYALLHIEKNIYTYIYSIYLSMVILAMRLFFDLYNLGFEDYFTKATLQNNSELIGSTGYTGSTLFFISLVLISALLYINKLNGKKSVLLFLFLIINILTLVFANSRALIVASILSISFLFFLLEKKSFLKIFLVTSIVSVIIVFTIPSLNEAIDLYIRLDTINQRDIFWESGMSMLSDYPILGVGTGVFQNYFYNYAPSYFFDFSNIGLIGQAKHTPHNIFIYYWAENGIAGFFIPCTFFIVFFYLSSKTIKMARLINREYFVLSLTITSIGTGMFFRSFFEVSGFLYYGFISYDLPFWLIFGILIFLHEQFKREIKKMLLIE